MAHVGQMQIAWCAFKRAELLGDRFWPDAEVRTRFLDHCKKRQDDILRDIDPKDRDQLPRRFAAELAFGQRYQKAYQDYEEKQIAASKELDDPHFYDTFHKKHGPIATPPGNADFILVEEVKKDQSWFLAWILVGAGLPAFLAALWIACFKD